jgi:hypothetical protein
MTIAAAGFGAIEAGAARNSASASIDCAIHDVFLHLWASFE